MTPIVLNMTVPPSANSIWRAVNGRVIKSKKYREWMKEQPVVDAPHEINAEILTGHFPLCINVAVDIQMKRPRSNSDCDNRIKPVLDKLAAYWVINNDKQVVDVRARWADVDGCIVTITPVKP